MPARRFKAQCVASHGPVSFDPSGFPENGEGKHTQLAPAASVTLTAQLHIGDFARCVNAVPMKVLNKSNAGTTT